MTIFPFSSKNWEYTFFLKLYGQYAWPYLIFPSIPRYNIPSNTVSGIKGGANNSYNNNVYNIDIALNGTNVTADDVMRKFKAELALVNAREGRVRTVGGSV